MFKTILKYPFYTKLLDKLFEYNRGPKADPCGIPHSVKLFFKYVCQKQFGLPFKF
jgi:hypothetical protein